MNQALLWHLGPEATFYLRSVPLAKLSKIIAGEFQKKSDLEHE